MTEREEQVHDAAFVQAFVSMAMQQAARAYPQHWRGHLTRSCECTTCRIYRLCSPARKRKGRK